MYKNEPKAASHVQSEMEGHVKRVLTNTIRNGENPLNDVQV